MSEDFGIVSREDKSVYFDDHKFSFADLRGWTFLSVTRLTDEALRAGIVLATVRYGRRTRFPFQLCVLMYAKTQNMQEKKPIEKVLFWEDSDRFPAVYGSTVLDVLNGVPAWGSVVKDNYDHEVLFNTRRSAVVGQYVSKLVGKRCVAFVHPDDQNKMDDPLNMHVRVTFVYQDF